MQAFSRVTCCEQAPEFSPLNDLFTPMIQKLKKEVGCNADLYIEPCVSSVAHDQQGFFTLSQSIERFLQDPDRKALLLTGYPQSGKTFATQMYTLQQSILPVIDYKVFFAPLQQVKDPFTNLIFKSFAYYQANVPLNLQYQLAHRKILFIFDGYDQIDFQENQTNIPICYTNYLKEWPGAKFIFTCQRSFYKKQLSKRIFEYNFGLFGRGESTPFIAHLLPFELRLVSAFTEKKCQTLASRLLTPYKEKSYCIQRKLEELSTALLHLIYSLSQSVFEQEVLFNPFLEADQTNPLKEIKKIAFSALSYPHTLSLFIEKVFHEYFNWLQEASSSSQNAPDFFKQRANTVYNFLGRQDCPFKNIILGVCRSLNSSVFPTLQIETQDYACFFKVKKTAPPEPFTDFELTTLLTYGMSTDEQKQAALKDEDFKALLERFEKFNALE